MPKSKKVSVMSVTLVHYLRRAERAYAADAEAVTKTGHAHMEQQVRDLQADSNKCAALADALDDTGAMAVDGDLLVVG